MHISMSEEVIQEIEVALENTDAMYIESLLNLEELAEYSRLLYIARNGTLEEIHPCFNNAHIKAFHAFRVKAVFKYTYLPNPEWVKIC